MTHPAILLASTYVRKRAHLQPAEFSFHHFGFTATLHTCTLAMKLQACMVCSLWCAHYRIVLVASVTDVGTTSRNICNSTAQVHQRMINIVHGHGMSCYMFASSAKLCWCDSLYVVM